MLNQKPTFQKNKQGKLKYQQGLYVPVNKHKVIKLNNEGGIYYRSSYEKKLMIYLDHNTQIVEWGCETIEIPYTHVEPLMNKGVMEYKKSNHRYYPDFFYTLVKPDGTRKSVIVEVKPQKEVEKPELDEKKKYTKKQLENFDYAKRTWNKNMSKWDACIEYCRQYGIEFTIMNEESLDRMQRTYNPFMNYPQSQD